MNTLPISIIAASLFLASTALAQEEGEVDRLLGEGWHSYSEELDFEAAIQSYTAATEHPEASDLQLLEAYEYLAACRFALGDQEGARQALGSLLSINPRQELHDPSHSPDMLQMLETLRSAMDSEEPSTEEATSEPEPGVPEQSSERPIQSEVPGNTVIEDERRPIYRTWWFWTIIGVGLVGGVTAGIVIGVRNSGDEPPQGTLDPGVVQLPLRVEF